MDIKIGAKIHNRFDFEVIDVRTGEVTQRAEAENIVLDGAFTTSWLLRDRFDGITHIRVGRGTGVLSPSRTSLFDSLASYSTTSLQTVRNEPPLASSRYVRAIIPAGTLTGETITEVGLGNSTDVFTHALLQDSEGKPVSLGPKGEFEEIHIYATLFATIELPEHLSLINISSNALINRLLGSGTSYLTYFYARVYTGKNGTGKATRAGYSSSSTDESTRSITYIRSRLGVNSHNDKIWSLAITVGTSSSYRDIIQISDFPNELWPGYQFTNKNIDVADGVKTKFILPWSEINDTKPYTFYVDGTMQVEGTDYTIENGEDETSITFTNPPAAELAITGDWWVDYIPKDKNHVLDFIGLTIQFGEG